MKINILTFGIAREICGATTIELDIPDQCNTVDLMEILRGKYPQFDKLASCLLAVNQEYSFEPVVLQAGDEIAIIPPVSGG